MDLVSALSRSIRYVPLSWIAVLFMGCMVPTASTIDDSSSGQKLMQPMSPIIEEHSEGIESQSYAGVSMATTAGPYPTTLEGFLEDTVLIVFAEYGDFEVRNFYGYDLETGEPSQPNEEDQIDTGFDVADFVLHIEEVLWVDETVSIDEPIVLRVMWDRTPGWEESLEEVGLKKSSTGDRYLFMLARNPDGTHGILYDEHRLVADEQGLLYYSQMYPPYPVKHGVFTEGERYGEDRGEPITVEDLVSAAEARQ